MGGREGKWGMPGGVSHTRSSSRRAIDGGGSARGAGEAGEAA